eukprot:9472438-Pyramimonas_sp.AAC.1
MAVGFQEVLHWPTTEEWLHNPLIPFWELRRDRGSKVAIMWPTCLSHLQRGQWKSRERFGSAWFGCFQIDVLYLPRVDLGLDECTTQFYSYKEFSAARRREHLGSTGRRSGRREWGRHQSARERILAPYFDGGLQ